MKKGKKIILASLVCALGASAIGVSYRGGEGEEKMHKKLINQETERVIVEVNGDEITFDDPILEVQMSEIGVFIPPAFREKFGGKEYVKLGDKEFIEAFETFFVPNYRKAVYSWQEVKN